MSIQQYQKDGVALWRVYLDLRSRKNPRIRVQKRINAIESEQKAIAEEKRLLRELTQRMTQEEQKGSTWGDVIDKWLRQQTLFPTRSYVPSTLVDYEGMLRKWTHPWIDRVASELSRGDGREVLRNATEAEKSRSLLTRLKAVINMVYLWGIEEKLIVGPNHSPVYGLQLELKRGEKRPEILTIEQIRTLLLLAREQKYPWYPIWVAAILTGCRSGELHQLRREDLEVISREDAIRQDSQSRGSRRYGFLRVRRSWDVRTKSVGTTKAGSWRTVPVSSEFYWFLVHDLKIENLRSSDYLLPRFWKWDQGLQASVLRGFCQANRLPSIRFHSLRACFATQLITTGVPATVVMKICGWQDMKTMQRYIRLAGVEEAGATESLRLIPTEEEVMEKVVSLLGHKRAENPI